MSGKQFTVTGNESSPNQPTPKVTPPGMEQSAADHEEETSTHDQLPTLSKLRGDIDMPDSHLHATITYFCRMVYPNDGERVHTPSAILDEFLNVFPEICADENDVLPFQLANLEMLEIRLKEGLEAIQEKKEELGVELGLLGYDQECSDDEITCCHRCGCYFGELEGDVSDEVPWCHRCAVNMEEPWDIDEGNCYCYGGVYNEGSTDDDDDDDESYYQCASESEDDLCGQCASSSKTAEDEAGSFNKGRSSTRS